MPRRETTIILAVAGLLGLLVLGAWWLMHQTDMGDGDASAPGAVSSRDDAVIGPEADPEERVIHGSRYQETDPAPEGADPTVEDAAFVVRVVDESDAPVATVSVGLCVQSADFKIGAALPTAVTDAQGIAKMKSVPSGPLRVVACAPGRMPIRVPVPLDAEEVVVRLASSPALEGVVRIDGAAPTTPIGFTVSGYREPSASWTPAERHFCRVCARNPGSIAMTTDAGGAFALRGLDADELVTIGFGTEFVKGGRSRLAASFECMTPKRDLVIDLTRLPTVRGKLVLRDPDPSALFAMHIVKFRIEGDGKRRDGQVAGHHGQVFEIPLTEVLLDRVSITVTDFQGKILAQREHVGPVADGHDFGDIAIPDADLTTKIRVQDRQGKPIEGAKARIGTRVSAPTDDQGLTTVTPAPNDRTVHVGAFGFKAGSATLPESHAGPFVVELGRANRLAVIVHRPDGKAAVRGLRVALTFPKPIAAGAPELIAGFADVRGAANGGLLRSGKEHSLIYNLPDDGRLTLSDWPQDQGFTITISDAYGARIIQEPAVLGPAEELQFERTLPRPPRTVAGRVRDGQGAALEGVTAKLGGSPFGVTSMTGKDGRFACEDVYGEDLVLTLSKAGFVTGSFPESALLTDVFTLEKARAIFVEVIDAAGRRVDATKLRIEFEGSRHYFGIKQGRGLYRVNDTPNAEGTVVVSFGKKEVKEKIWPDQNRITVFQAR